MLHPRLFSRLREAFTLYSVWWMEMVVAVGLIMRAGIYRVFLHVSGMEAEVAYPALDGGLDWGVVKLITGLGWMLVLIYGRRSHRAGAALAGLIVCFLTTISWYNFEPRLPIWTYWLAAGVLPSMVAFFRHFTQVYAPAPVLPPEEKDRPVR
jgi:hypothetical protein